MIFFLQTIFQSQRAKIVRKGAAPIQWQNMGLLLENRKEPTLPAVQQKVRALHQSPPSSEDDVTAPFT